jgi:hypothetical protein
VNDYAKFGFTISLHLALFALITKPPDSSESGLTVLFGVFSFGVFTATLLRHSELVGKVFPALVADDDQ